jgi:hypothetical protein
MPQEKPKNTAVRDSIPLSKSPKVGIHQTWGQISERTKALKAYNKSQELKKYKSVAGGLKEKGHATGGSYKSFK